ncbi:universal stress protein [Luteococcus sanguinis]|uniref:Universal stress protein n=1 Tax=Luteococcus sanguinis TaxID=174038 RepID=A0ABW1X5V6_9ACTN
MAQMNDYNIIVVGTDGSSLAEPTVARAAWLAAREEAELVIVCAWSSLSQRVEAINTQTLGGDVSTAQQVHGREAAEEALLRAAHVAGEYGAKVSAALLVEGEPAAALLQTAGTHDADLIVIGAIRDTSIADRFLGNVATEVVKKATCEVLVIRPTMPVTEVEVPRRSDAFLLRSLPIGLRVGGQDCVSAKIATREQSGPVAGPDCPELAILADASAYAGPKGATMSEFFETFAPGMRHWREQQDLEKVLVVDQKKGGRGPMPLDLDSGKVRLVMPNRSKPEPEPDPTGD